jgi:hypothetical protein
MQKALREGKRTLALLSVDYLAGDLTQAQWAAADLRAFLEGRPIAAVPVSWMHRLALLARRRPAETGVGLVVAVLLLAGVIGWWDWTRVRTSYYANYAEVDGRPVGVGAVRSWQQRHRGVSYRFSTTRGHVVKVERTNGAGQLRDNEEGEASWELVYDEGGRVRENVEGLVRRGWQAHAEQGGLRHGVAPL